MSLFKKAEMSHAYFSAARKSHFGHAPRPIAERFEEYVYPEPNSGCWLWGGPLNSDGYSNLFIGSKADGTSKITLGHRVSYEMLRGPIPEGMEVDHKCRTRCCVNPDHLQLLTPALHQNITIERLPEHPLTTKMRLRAHCPNGHPWTLENTRLLKTGYRDCIPCRRQYLRDWRAARRNDHVSI